MIDRIVFQALPAVTGYLSHGGLQPAVTVLSLWFDEMESGVWHTSAWCFPVLF